ncbi:MULTISPECIES: hypothetical protein [unclassified Kaistella]|uniref:hypothetical protein n=1 Tax=unclassified Kaistella TaxID=2762626 RepID=UPI002732DA98|nr:MULTISPECIES: hypothetical protein [unclassified Kaistella]MCZ2083026.1 hypothetical protein [Flavobacteriales bacterium]MDP2454760.1 hypothetical protein [Kaistella sp. SH11-4b]MDP2457497.1 hypothetical protein [Kaistella sp. SH40-3]MDP2460257.1 hypothetical protein [Kaistella sp. SH19-2b]
MDSENNKKSKDENVKKENQDFPNLPAASDKIKNENVLKKQIKKTSELNPDGKTDNIDEKSEN